MWLLVEVFFFGDYESVVKKMLIKVCKKKKNGNRRKGKLGAKYLSHFSISTESPARCGPAAATFGLARNISMERSVLVLESWSAKVPFCELT